MPSNEKFKNIAVLGSTGSIGKSALDVARASGGKFRIAGLSAGRNISLLESQIEEFKPKYVSVLNAEDARALKKKFSAVKILSGEEGAEEIARIPEADIVLSAIVGAAGLKSAYSALCAGKRLALANKESMVIAGDIMKKIARKNGAEIIPVDSEHSAVFQCLKADGNPALIKRMILTASGGPFFNRPKETFDKVTPEEALKHPTWNMGRKISVDSATLMNKGLEAIEAHFLFGFAPEQISILVHPQSVVHSMVEYIDGSIIAHLGKTDMRIPVQYAFSYPERAQSACEPFDFAKTAPLEFFEPDFKKFPSLSLAYKALEMKGAAPIVLNAVNEIAVQAFLERKITFNEIPETIEKFLPSASPKSPSAIEEVLAIDADARDAARRTLKVG